MRNPFVAAPGCSIPTFSLVLPPGFPVCSFADPGAVRPSAVCLPFSVFVSMSFDTTSLTLGSSYAPIGSVSVTEDDANCRLAFKIRLPKIPILSVDCIEFSVNPIVSLSLVMLSKDALSGYVPVGAFDATREENERCRLKFKLKIPMPIHVPDCIGFSVQPSVSYAVTRLSEGTLSGYQPSGAFEVTVDEECQLKFKIKLPKIPIFVPTCLPFSIQPSISTLMTGLTAGAIADYRPSSAFSVSVGEDCQLKFKIRIPLPYFVPSCIPFSVETPSMSYAVTELSADADYTPSGGFDISVDEETCAIKFKIRLPKIPVFTISCIPFSVEPSMSYAVTELSADAEYTPSGAFEVTVDEDCQLKFKIKLPKIPIAPCIGFSVEPSMSYAVTELSADEEYTPSGAFEVTVGEDCQLKFKIKLPKIPIVVPDCIAFSVQASMSVVVTDMAADDTYTPVGGIDASVDAEDCQLRFKIRLPKIQVGPLPKPTASGMLLQSEETAPGSGKFKWVLLDPPGADVSADPVLRFNRTTKLAYWWQPKRIEKVVTEVKVNDAGDALIEQGKAYVWVLDYESAEDRTIIDIEECDGAS